MHVFTLGMPAIGPFSTLSWQSVQTAFLAICVLCGNGSGWRGAVRTLKKSRAASPAVLCAVVNTDDEACGGDPAPHAVTHTSASATSGHLAAFARSAPAPTGRSSDRTAW